VCERIPYLILPVMQLSREPLGRRRSVRRSAEPDRYEQAAGQYAGPVSNRTIRRSDTSEPPGRPPGPSRSEPSAEAIYASRLASRRACVEPSAEARHVRAAAHTAPSTERSVRQPVAAEPRTIQRSSRSQRAPQIPNRTP